MSTIVEIAKSLLVKGIKLNDIELIDMANKMLEEAVGTTEEESTPEVVVTKKVKSRAKVQKTTKTAEKKSSKNLIDQFTIAKSDDKIKYLPVNAVKDRPNIFVDDGLEAKSEEFATPLITPTKRDRKKATKVKKICGADVNGKLRDDDGCGKECLVDPLYARELFICEACLLKKVKK